MSIHIKGKLPTGRCEAQFFPNGCVAFYDVEGRYLSQTKYKELPPHGRLIDADKLVQHVKGQVELVRQWGIEEMTAIAEKLEEGVLAEIGLAPTIIEADRGDT